MTLIVVTKDRVYTDSRCTNPMGSYIVDKRIDFSIDDVDYTAAGAGDVAEIENVVAGVLRDGLDYVRPSACKNNTEVFIRRLTDGALFVVRSQKEAHVTRYIFSSESGMEEVAGSGYYHFWAYYQEHRDIQKAFMLTCEHCDSVALPMREF